MIYSSQLWETGELITLCTSLLYHKRSLVPRLRSPAFVAQCRKAIKAGEGSLGTKLPVEESLMPFVLIVLPPSLPAPSPSLPFPCPPFSLPPLSVSPSLLALSLSLSFFSVWQWQDEHGQWRDYEPNAGSKIEAAHSQGVCGGTTSFSASGRGYRVDTNKMEQVNSSTGVVRKIQRLGPVGECLG